MANSTRSASTGGNSKVKASAAFDGLVTPSDTTPLNFKSLYIGDGITGTIIVSRDGGNTISPEYAVAGPQTLNVSGNRVMAATSLTGGSAIWQDW